MRSRPVQGHGHCHPNGRQARQLSDCAVENLAWQVISLGGHRPVDRRPLPAQGYPQWFPASPQIRRLKRVPPAEGLWINLWKLWIVRHCWRCARVPL